MPTHTCVPTQTHLCAHTDTHTRTTTHTHKAGSKLHLRRANQVLGYVKWPPNVASLDGALGPTLPYTKALGSRQEEGFAVIVPSPGAAAGE